MMSASAPRGSENAYQAAADQAKDTQEHVAYEKTMKVLGMVHKSIEACIQPIPMLSILILFAHYRVRTDLGFASTDVYPKNFETCYELLVAVVAITLLVGIIEMFISLLCGGDNCVTMAKIGVMTC